MSRESRPQWWNVAFVMFIALIGINFCQAKERGRGELPSGTGIVVSLPDAPRSLGNRFLHQSCKQYGLDAGVKLTSIEAGDSRFLLPLVQELQQAKDRESSKCVPEDPHFAETLEQASEELNFQNEGRAQELLERAVQTIACETEILSSASIARYFFLGGLLDIQQGLQATTKFELALSIDPDFPAPTLYSDRVREQFTEARELLKDRRRVRLNLARDRDELELWFDGRKTTGDSIDLLPGRHFLQRVRASQPTTATVFTLESTDDGGAVDWPPVELRPLESAEVIERLRQAVASGQPDAPLAAALEALVQTGRHPWLVLIAAPAATGEARALILKPGEVIQSGQVRPSEGRDEQLECSERHDWRLTTVLGSVALAAGSAFGGLSLYADQSPLSWDPFLETGGRTISAIAWTATAATLTSAYFAWRRPYFVPTRSRSVYVLPQFSSESNAPHVGIVVRVLW